MSLLHSLHLRSPPVVLCPVGWSKLFCAQPVRFLPFWWWGIALEDTSKSHELKQVLLSLQSQWASAGKRYLRAATEGMQIASTAIFSKDMGIFLRLWLRPLPSLWDESLPLLKPSVSPLLLLERSYAAPLGKCPLTTCTGRFRAESPLQIPETRPCPRPCVWVKRGPKVASEEQEVLWAPFAFCINVSIPAPFPLAGNFDRGVSAVPTLGLCIMTQLNRIPQSITPYPFFCNNTIAQLLISELQERKAFTSYRQEKCHLALQVYGNRKDLIFQPLPSPALHPQRDEINRRKMGFLHKLGMYDW